MTTIQIKVKNCQDCPRCDSSRTQGAGYALDFKCTECGRKIAGYVEWDSEFPKEVPSWCPLRVD